MIPSKEQMYQWYIIERKNKEEVGKMFAEKNFKRIANKLLKEYNIEKSKEQIKQDALYKMKKTNLEKYNTEFVKKVSKLNKNKPSKEQMYQWYIIENKSLEDINKLIGYKSGSREASLLVKEYNIVKPIDIINKNKINNMKKVKQKKYGDMSYINIKKIQKTKLEKYGNENYNNNEKARKTCIEKYGVISYTQTDEYINKSKKTKLEKYGNENYINWEKINKTIENKYGSRQQFYKLIHQKSRKSFLNKYSVNHNHQLHIPLETIDILQDKNKIIAFVENNNITNRKDLSEQLQISYSRLNTILRTYNMNDYLITTNSSYIEKEIANNFPQFNVKNQYRILDGKEIDIYIPEKKIGIEFNGNYWHSELYKSMNYHKEKSKLAEEKSIFLYHIFEYEWITKQDKIINQLNNLLGLNTQKIYARKCIVKEVDNKEKKQFLNLNHLQGNDKASIKLGLYFNNELVSLMTFCKPRFNKKYEWELSRFCCKADCNVIGGASKLFKYFVSIYNPTNILSYSDIAKTRGNLYNVLGFKKSKINIPSYVWCNTSTGEIATRYMCQKKNLQKKGFLNGTETDIMRNLGYSKIYDCGTVLWIWKQ